MRKQIQRIRSLESSWPVLDEAALYGLAGDVVRALNPHTEADPVGILIQLLIAFGNVIGNNPYYQVESDRTTQICSVFTSAPARRGEREPRVAA